LWTLDQATCEAAHERLMIEGVLERNDTGRHARAGRTTRCRSGYRPPRQKVARNRHRLSGRDPGVGVGITPPQCEIFPVVRARSPVIFSSTSAGTSQMPGRPCSRSKYHE
jgi:hypothetical protein